MKDLQVQVDIVPRFFELVGPGVGIHTVEGLPLIGLGASTAVAVVPILEAEDSRFRSWPLGSCGSSSVPGADRDRDQARLTRPGVLSTGPNGSRETGHFGSSSSGRWLPTRTSRKQEFAHLNKHLAARR